jgi:hypothetical protein
MILTNFLSMVINVNNGIVKMNLVAQSSEQPITDDNNPPKFDE